VTLGTFAAEIRSNCNAIYEAGLFTAAVSIGFESGSDRVLKILNKAEMAEILADRYTKISQRRLQDYVDLLG
jgi:radical SAM superfamily enzyme YgiQ (UPF0313 family)